MASCCSSCTRALTSSGQKPVHILQISPFLETTNISNHCCFLRRCRCVAKKQRFAPASLYRPFGEQAAGVRSLSQFQALQDGEQELVSLRELGLTDAEIQLWLKRESPEQEEKVGDGLIVRSDKCDRISLTVAGNIYIPAVSS